MSNKPVRPPGLVQVLADVLPVYREKGPKSLETQLLRGESFVILENVAGTDLSYGYPLGDQKLKGYIINSLSTIGEPYAVTHRVCVRGAARSNELGVESTFDLLPFGSLVGVQGKKDGFTQIDTGEWVLSEHLVPMGSPAEDWVAYTQEFTGARYQWGGKTFAGIDCSGLIQVALSMQGIFVPHQANRISDELTERKLVDDIDPSGPYLRGDIVYWDGHVGVMCDEHHLFHATKDPHKSAVKELLPEVVKRRPKPIRLVQRFKKRA